MVDLVFSQHAAERWYQRCHDLDFRKEMETAKRDKAIEKKRCKRHIKSRAYRTNSGVLLIVRNGIVVTVLG